MSPCYFEEVSTKRVVTSTSVVPYKDLHGGFKLGGRWDTTEDEHPPRGRCTSVSVLWGQHYTI